MKTLIYFTGLFSLAAGFGIASNEVAMALITVGIGTILYTVVVGIVID